MSGGVSIAGSAAWLADGVLQRLLDVLSSGGEGARVAGGAVRNALLGEVVRDIDIATTCLPDEVVRRAQAAGFRTVPTGYEHGTITVVADGRAFEVTTLRDDVETDGRHARVTFGRDWKRDAERRDFTINALYCDADGTVVDPVGGLADIARRVLRFIGDPEQRIREDYLRILRFFRFFAWYGAGRPDAAGLKACARLKDGIARLSAERVWSELRRLLAAPDPSRALLWMRQTGVLTAVLPESEKWGIDAIPALVAAERDLGWSPDPLRRLQAIVPPDPVRMKALGDRLRFSGAEAARMTLWAMAETVPAGTEDRELRARLYFGDRQAIEDRLALSWSSARSRAEADQSALFEAAGFARLMKQATGWEAPRFPISGTDLKSLGLSSGPDLGRLLRALEEEWVSTGFSVGRDALLERAAGLAGIQDGA